MAAHSADRRRSGRLSSSTAKTSQYFEADSSDDDDEDSAPRAAKRQKTTNGIAKKPSRKAATEDSDDGDDYKDESPEQEEDDLAHASSPQDDDEDDNADSDSDASNSGRKVTITPHIPLLPLSGISYTPTTLHPNTLTFLSLLATHNQRPWLQSHDGEYRRSLNDFASYITHLTTAALISADPTIPELPNKDIIFRIYRDVRFSKDPTPYKTHYSAAWSRTGRKGPYACYYLHVQPGGKSFMGGGLWMPEKEALARLRSSIDGEAERWREVMGEEAFRKAFLEGDGEGGTKRKGRKDTEKKKGKKGGVERELDGEGCVKEFVERNQEGALKTKPKGFDADHPSIGLLKLKNFTVGKSLSDELLTAKDSAKRIGEIVKAMTGFITFLNDIVMPDLSLDDDDDDDDDEDSDDED